MIKKFLSIIIITLFLFNSVSYALNPPSNLPKSQFREKFRTFVAFLSHEAINHYIKQQIKKILDIRGKDGLTQKDVDIKGLNIRFISIPYLLKKTGQFAHVGLGRQYGMPVVYVDSEYYDNSAIIQHETDEIIQWEELRTILSIDRKAMRQWIIDHIDSADKKLIGTKYEGLTTREIAQKIHELSHPLDSLPTKDLLEYLDYDYIDQMLTLYGSSEESKDINIAAKSEDPRKNPSDKKQKDAIFEALIGISQRVNTSSISEYKEGVKKFLSQKGPVIVAECIFEYLFLLDKVYYTKKYNFRDFQEAVESYSEINPSFPDSSLDPYKDPYVRDGVLEIPEKFRRDLLDFFDGWGDSNTEESIGELQRYTKEHQQMFLDFTQGLGAAVIENFVAVVSREYYRQDSYSLSGLYKEHFLADDLGINLTKRHGKPWVSAIYRQRANPLIAYGNFSYKDIVIPFIKEHPKFQHLVQNFEEAIDALEKAENEEEKLIILNAIYLNKTHGALPRVVHRTIAPITIEETLAKKLITQLDNIFQTSSNPFLLREAYNILSILADIPQEKKEEVYLSLFKQAVQGIEDIGLRSWIAFQLTSDAEDLNLKFMLGTLVNMINKKWSVKRIEENLLQGQINAKRSFPLHWKRLIRLILHPQLEDTSDATVLKKYLWFEVYLDIHQTKDLVNTLMFIDEADQEKVYEIRYNKMRLTQAFPHLNSKCSYEDLIEEYVKILQIRSGNKKNIILRACSDQDKLIHVCCYKDRNDYGRNKILGQGVVNIKGDLNNRLIRITGLLNMAIAASNIRHEVSCGNTSMNGYELRLLDFIINQCEVITGVKALRTDILEFIKDLPLPHPVPLEELREVNELTKTALMSV